MSEADGKGIWMEGGGVIAERTNILINRLIDGMNEQEAYQVSKSGLDTMIRKVVGVDGDDTLREYRERVAKHGPFFVHLGTYTLADGYREGGDG